MKWGTNRQAGIVGALTALMASSGMLWVNQQWGGALPAQALSDYALSSLPLTIVRRLLTQLDSDAKPLAFAALTLTQVIVGAIVAIAYRRFARQPPRDRLLGGLALAVGFWLIWSIVAAPIAGLGWLATDAPGLWATQATILVGALAYGAMTAALVPWPRVVFAPATDVAGRALDRRRFIVAIAIVGLTAPALLSTGYLARYTQRLRRDRSPGDDAITITESRRGASDAFVFAGMPPVITPVDDFYIVSKNFVDPTVDAADWTLEVGGLVERALHLSYSDIRSREATNFISTLICISNTVGGEYLSNAVWTGFPLRDLLMEAGPLPGAVDLELHAADGYVESLPIDKALAPDTMLVHTINGVPLTDDHGYPTRLIVPGRYGIKNVKWITRLNVVDEDVLGYWQQRQWSESAVVETTSRIDTPRRGQRLPRGELVRVGGVAFAGDRGISRVELSLDDGETWTDAELMDAVSPLAWRLWKVEYTPVTAGLVKLAVRATDGAGVGQSHVDREPLPEGATGYHRTWFDVRETDS